LTHHLSGQAAPHLSHAAPHTFGIAQATPVAWSRPRPWHAADPQRVTTTLNWALHQRLQDLADEQGRSLSGLIAFVLEKATA